MASFPATVAESSIEPSAAVAGVGWTMMLTVAELPAARLPRSAVIVPFTARWGSTPPLDDAETNWTPGGSVERRDHARGIRGARVRDLQGIGPIGLRDGRSGTGRDGDGEVGRGATLTVTWVELFDATGSMF